MLSRLMQRLDNWRAGIAENARRADAGVAPRDASTSPMPGSTARFNARSNAGSNARRKCLVKCWAG